jgi:error-prone DNA polymerase
MQYIYEKYGRERAALAATVISFRYKSAFRSVGKVLGIEESALELYLKNIDRRDRSQAWDEQLLAQGLDDTNPKLARLVHLTRSLIGFPRHLSQHVGGFVISSGPLSQLVPVENAAMADRTVIQWDKDDLETLGLLKVDVLALGMLSAIRRSFDMIRQHYGRALSIAEITSLGDDPAVYADLQAGDSIGVFQVESRAQMSMLPRLKPASYYDLVIQIAIVRPGPIQGDMVHPYLRRRSGKEVVTYPSNEVKEVLSRTLGVPIFQEQVIKLAMVAAGFSGGEADQLRRAMASWKRSTQLQGFRSKLVNGMLARGYDEAFAERVFQQICGFGEYGFPESHAASFAVLAYVSAWLKHYFPQAFYASLLNSLPMGFYSSSQLVQDAVRHHVRVLPVDINQSFGDHRLEQQVLEQPSVDPGFALRLGFRQVRGLSAKGIDRIERARPDSGFRSLQQVQALGLNQLDLEALAGANAFAQLKGNRYQARWDLMKSLDDAPLWSERIGNGETDEHLSVKEDVQFTAPDQWQNMQEDYQSTGLSLDGHPVALLRKAGALENDVMANALWQQPHKSLVSVSGLVTGKQSPGTAAGVSFYTLEDETGNINVVIWRATARAQKLPYLRAQLLRVVGILEQEAGVIHVIAGRLEDLTPQLDGLRTKVREFH